jgi:hypothetical protein
MIKEKATLEEEKHSFEVPFKIQAAFLNIELW